VTEVPDLDDPAQLKALVAAVNELRAQGRLLAYHDRSDGGLWAAVCEMAFAGHRGVSLNVDILVTEGDGIADSRAEYGDSKNWATQVGERRNELTLKALFNEELGVVLQVPTAVRDEVMATLRAHGLSRTRTSSARPTTAAWSRSGATPSAVQRAAARPAPGLGRGQLAHRAPARQPRLRRCRTCRRGAADDPGLHLHLSFDPAEDVAAPRHRQRRAPEDGHPARAGRQLACRDELRDGAGRLRHLRRAHDRPAGRPRAAGPVPGLRGLRRLQLRRHAGRRRGLGALDPVQPGAGRGSSPPSSTARHASRWACATAAR
jgi:hypothetical protein